MKAPTPAAPDHGVVCFHRAEGWYPLTLQPGEDLLLHIDHNPGTVLITDGLTGEVLWRPQ